MRVRLRQIILTRILCREDGGCFYGKTVGFRSDARI